MSRPAARSPILTVKRKLTDNYVVHVYEYQARATLVDESYKYKLTTVRYSWSWWRCCVTVCQHLLAILVSRPVAFKPTCWCWSGADVITIWGAVCIGRVEARSDNLELVVMRADLEIHTINSHMKTEGFTENKDQSCRYITSKSHLTVSLRAFSSIAALNGVRGFRFLRVLVWIAGNTCSDCFCRLDPRLTSGLASVTNVETPVDLHFPTKSLPCELMFSYAHIMMQQSSTFRWLVARQLPPSGLVQFSLTRDKHDTIWQGSSHCASPAGSTLPADIA